MEGLTLAGVASILNHNKHILIDNYSREWHSNLNQTNNDQVVNGIGICVYRRYHEAIDDEKNVVCFLGAADFEMECAALARMFYLLLSRFFLLGWLNGSMIGVFDFYF